MNRGKLLVRLATKNQREDKYVEKGDEELFSVIAESKHEFANNPVDEILSSSFQDFESSGSEYIPSEISDVSLNSNGSFDVELEQSPELHHLENLEINHSETSTLSILKNKQEQEPSTSNVPIIAPENIASIIIPNYSSADHTENAKIINNLSISDAIPNYQQQYTKKACARERPTICPICYNDVVTHFSRHLIRHHKDHREVILLQSLKPRSKERLDLVTALRKQGYFYLNTERNVLNPVRRSNNSETTYFVCTYCLGHYSKKSLYKHVKKCKNKPADKLQPGKNCLSTSQTYMATVISKNHEFLKASRIKQEVFGIMRPDEISAIAKNDPLICMYGEALLNKHKRQQMAIVVSNKIREMGRLLKVLKEMHVELRGLFDALKPELFASLLSATKVISGYDSNTKGFRAPSLALHMGTNLKIICDVAIKIVIEKKNIPNIIWDDRSQKKIEIKDLKKLIEGHWCNEISSLALKTLKENQWQKPKSIPLTSDIQCFQKYVNELADNTYNKLINNVDIKTNYKILTESVLALTIMFNRKRVGDVQYLKIETYNIDHTRDGKNQEAFMDSLTEVEKIISKTFKRVVTGGKGSRPVPILFSKRMQKFITILLNIRKSNKNIVPETNPYMFANPGSQNKWMSGANIIRKFANNCGAKNPSLLTSTRFRKHIATTLQLMSMEDNEMEQIATFMGHTKKTHTEFYRLSEDIYQTAKVAKVLMLLEKGKGKEFKGKTLNDIELENEIYYSSESENEDDDLAPVAERALNRIERTTIVQSSTNSSANKSLVDNTLLRSATVLLERIEENVENNKNERLESLFTEEDEEQEMEVQETVQKKNQVYAKDNQRSKINGRIKWSNKEKSLVLAHFRKHIQRKTAPKKHECDELLAKHSDIFVNKDWVRIKTLVYNTFRNK